MPGSLATPTPSPQLLRTPAKAEITHAFLSVLPASVQQTLLLTAIKMHPDIYTLAVAARAEEAARQAAAIHLSFDELAKTCWHEINSAYRGLRDSQLYTIAGKVRETVLDILRDDILAKVADDSSYETKRSALETLRKIGKTCWMAQLRYIDECVADDEVMKVIGDGMEGVAESMSIGERILFLDDNPLWLESCSELWNMWVADENVAVRLDGGLAEVMRLFGESIPTGLQ
ncbi:hypothetical protein BZA05DRAFT_404238 [Tricharina praecox]|uniref:uncharacterized protein n=1 Tax=Tricharina praecox TaxID=43433 RepID=UPI0022209B39|nr:uncharacterized protein BZA05DRAFT_404238 [Tricharina praecox]KAI5848040.1 hypothetical protein BZA05DRAFT_404238 [Tricharina praecox]